MKIRIAILFLLVLTLFLGCSRESGIARNPLLGKHPVVFLLRHDPGDIDAFIDSVLALPGDSVVIPDTVNATIDDTIWCVGYFGGSSQAIAAYRWKVTSKTDFTQRKNNDLLTISFDSTGIYQAKFLLRDNLNALDSAGGNQYIRIIDTKPLISFSADTAFARAKGPVNFSFLATDSFGTVRSIRLDFDLNGKWDTTITWSGGDSVALSLPKGTKVDSAGNQRIAVSITDDDNNSSSDTLILHFNKPPTIQLAYPIDSSKVNILERFAFYWDAQDSDNPRDLRYTLQVGKVTPLTSKHVAAANLRTPTWELIQADGERADSSLTGNLYWRVIVTDGLDTVTSSTRKFFLGDPNIKFGVIHGVVKMQGSDRHDGVRITLLPLGDGTRLITHTNAQYPHKGDFHFLETPPGCYQLDVRDTSGLYYSPVSRDSVCIELGDTLTLDTLWLLDKSKPRIVRTSILDTLYATRSITISGQYADSGSLVDPTTFKAWLDGSAKTVTSSEDGSWSAALTNVPDGLHTFQIIVKDRAGNTSDTLKAVFKVKALQMAFLVNGENATVVRSGGTLAADIDTLKFRLTVSNANPAIDSVYFDLKGDGKVDKKIKATAGQTVFSYDTSAKNMAVNDTVRIAVLHVKTAGLTYLDTVSYRVRNRASAGVIFVRPGKDTTVTRNDAISLVIQAEASEGHALNRWQWDIDGTTGYELDYNTETSVSFPASSFGTFKLRVKITDDGTNSSTDSVSVTVVSQPPTVQASVARDTAKINGKVPLSATATDIAPGVISSYEWKCGSGGYAPAPGGFLEVTVQGTPGTINCIVRATDNDNEVAYDTVVVLVKQDKPFAKVLIDSMDVTIRDQLQLRAQIIDTLGLIAKIEWSCGIPGTGGVSTWRTVSKSDTIWTAPSIATSKYYCVVRATDDDGQTATDTTTFRIKRDPPYVRVFTDSINASINDEIELNAIVIDTLGSIDKIQWSCGNAGGATNWITVSSPLYSHTLPSVGNPNYICVIRAMDDDSTWSYDTTFIAVDQDAPTVTVKKEIISTRVNESFFVDCNASDKFGDTDFRWRCGIKGGTMGAWTPIYEQCGLSLTAPSTGTSNYICIVEATDEDAQKAYDTANVLVVQPPEAILAGPGKLAVWSGDGDIPEEARFWHYDINGASSIIGVPFGNTNNRDYWWQFSNYEPTAWLQGPTDGTLDHTYEGFDQALQRPKTASSIQVRLDFRDSILPTGETDPTFIYDFYIRHLDYDTIQVQFARFWANLGQDTVIQKASRALTVVSNNSGPIVAYRESVGGLGYVKKYSGSSWVVVGGSDFGSGSTVDTVRLARDPSTEDLYAAYRNTSGNITVKRSAAGTGAWAVVGGGDIAVNGNNTRKIAIAAKSGKVAVSWIGADQILGTMVSIPTINSGDWGWNGAAGTVGAAHGTSTDLDVAMAFNTGATDTLALLYVSTGYTTRIRLARGTNLGTLGTQSDVTANSDAISVAYAANGRIFVGYNNRADYGPHVIRMNSASLGTKTHLAGFGTSSNVSLHRVGRATSLAVGTDDNPYLAYDDDFFAPQVHVWKHNGTAWKLHGENMLPHFKDTFYALRGYYLRATSPSLSVAPDGNTYIGMMAIDGRGASGANSGPIVMKYTP